MGFKALVASSVFLAVVSVATAQTPPAGSVGGSPTRAERFPGGQSEALVIGAGGTYAGRTEVIAYDHKNRHLCVDGDFVETRFTVMVCNHSTPRDGRAIEISDVGEFGPVHNPAFTYVLGELAPGVAAVSVRVRRRSGINVRSALVSQVDETFAARFNQVDPFGQFIEAIPGSVAPGRLSVAARDANGVILGQDLAE